VVGPGHERRGELLAAALPDGGPAQQRKRNVAAHAGRYLTKLRLAEPGPPQLVAGDQGGRGVRAAARQAGRYRNPLADLDLHRGLGPAGQGGRGESAGRTRGQVRAAGRKRRRAFSGRPHADPFGRPHGHLVEQ